MDKYPAYQTYAMDENADEKRMHWTTWQWGCFYRLRKHAWGQSPQGRFLNDKRLLKIVTGFQAGDNDKDFVEVISYFKRQGKFLVDVELVKQTLKMKKFSKKQSRKANKRWSQARAANEKPANEYLPTAAETAQPEKAKLKPGQVFYNGQPRWISELGKVCDDLEKEIVAHRKKERDAKAAGGDSHNIWLAELEHLQARLQEAKKLSLGAVSGRVSKPAASAPAATKKADPKVTLQELIERIREVEQPDETGRSLYYAGEKLDQLKEDWKKSLARWKREVAQLQKEVAV